MTPISVQEELTSFKLPSTQRLSLSPSLSPSLPPSLPLPLSSCFSPFLFSFLSAARSGLNFCPAAKKSITFISLPFCSISLLWFCFLFFLSPGRWPSPSPWSSQLLLLSQALGGGCLERWVSWGGSPPFSSETLGGSREPPSPSLPPSLPRSHMEPGFFQHGGKGNRRVWLGRTARHPPFPGSPDLGSPRRLSLFSLSHQPGLCVRPPAGQAWQSPGVELLRRLLI